MRTIEEIRRLRLRELVTQYGKKTTLNVLLELERTDSAVSGYANGHREMGSTFARMIEQRLGRERGWMDSDPDSWPFGKIAAARMAKLSDRARELLEEHIDQTVEFLEKAQMPPATVAALRRREDANRLRAHLEAAAQSPAAAALAELAAMSRGPSS